MHALKDMQEMHQKMANACTPAERQAPMTDHMAMMQRMMDMMVDRMPPAAMGK